MSILSAVIQGIIQGLTEFLPVSSSGHLSLYQHFSGIQRKNISDDKGNSPYTEKYIYGQVFI